MTEEPENDPNANTDLYRDWLAEKREVKAPETLAESVAAQVQHGEVQRGMSVAQWARAAILIAAAIGGLGRYVLLGILILSN